MALVQLGADNKVLKETILHKLTSEKKEPCDSKLYDFDDVFYRVYIDPEDRSKMLLSVSTPAWGGIRKHSEGLIRTQLEGFVKEFTADGCNFEIELEQKNQESAEEISTKFSKLRMYTLGGPLYFYLDALAKGTSQNQPFSFKLRRDTHFWIVPKKDRVACIMAMEFPIKADYIIANQILHEFIEVRNMKEMNNTPVIGFQKKEPGELKGVSLPSYSADAFLGYFTILILPSHIKDNAAGGNRLFNAVENIIGFRAYLTYHIKCAKAFFHSSMRTRVSTMLQVLNRARYEPEDSRKKKKIIKSAK